MAPFAFFTAGFLFVGTFAAMTVWLVDTARGKWTSSGIALLLLIVFGALLGAGTSAPVLLIALGVGIALAAWELLDDDARERTARNSADRCDGPRSVQAQLDAAIARGVQERKARGKSRAAMNLDALYAPIFRRQPEATALVPVGPVLTLPRAPQQESLFDNTRGPAPKRQSAPRTPRKGVESRSLATLLVTPDGRVQTRDQFLQALGDPRPMATCVSLATCVACDLMFGWKEQKYETDWSLPDADERSFTHIAQLLETRGVRDRAVNDAHKVISATKRALSSLLPEPMDAGHYANLRRIWASHAADPDGDVNRLLGIGYLGLLGSK